MMLQVDSVPNEDELDVYLLPLTIKDIFEAAEQLLRLEKCRYIIRKEIHKMAKQCDSGTSRNNFAIFTLTIACCLFLFWC